MIKSILTTNEQKEGGDLLLQISGSEIEIAIELNMIIKNLIVNKKGSKVIHAVMSNNFDELMATLKPHDSELETLIRRLEEVDTYNISN